MANAPEHDIDIADLQAAIDASAHATIEKKAASKAQQATEESASPSQEAPKAAIVTAPEQPEVAAEPVAVSVAPDSSATSIKVAVNSTPPVAEPKASVPAQEPEPSPESESVQIAIKSSSGALTPKPTVDDDQPAEPAAQDSRATMSHHGKTLQPVAAESEASTVEVQQSSALKEAEEPVAAKSPELAPEKPASPEEVSIKIEGLQASNMKKEAEAAQKASEDLAAEEGKPTKIFDTKEYHLPIKPNRHHRKGGIPNWVAVAVLLALVIGGVAYAYLSTDLLSL